MGFLLAWVPALVILGIVMVALIAHQPKYALFLTLLMSFAQSGLSRYVPIFTWGLTVDLLLLLCWLIGFFKYWKKFEVGRANKSLTWVWVAWYAYVFFELFNPQKEAATIAWFYAMRGVGLYSMLLTPLALILMRKPKDMDFWHTIVILNGFVGAAWGLKQIYIGVTGIEAIWLQGPAGSTHVLFGQLRAFSFFSDASQFGASMGHIGLLSSIFVLATNSKVKQIALVITALMCFWGMVLSGSRAPIAVPAIGGLVFLALSGRHQVFIIGLFIGSLAFGFLKYTSIAQSNYYIGRMRTALNPSEDPSYIARLEKEAKMKVYLASRPFGGGIGAAGFWGLRFTPHTVLANTATDGLYYRIWMEGGIVGLTLYLGILIYLLIHGSLITLQIQSPHLRIKSAAIMAGIGGLMVASIANELMVQMPTGIIVYGQLAFIWQMKRWDKEYLHEEKLKMRRKSLIYE